MRITEKKENGFYELKEGQEIYGEENGIRLVQIVGEYEDIKDELEVKLYTIIEALNEGVWIKFFGEEPFFCKYIYLEGIHAWANKFHYSLIADTFSIKHELRLSDYGKTWALTKEVLE